MMESVWNWGNRLKFAHIVDVGGHIASARKLRERHGIGLHIIYFSDWKGSRLGQRNSQERASARYVIFRRIFAEVLQGTESFRSCLNLVKDDQRPLWIYRLAHCDSQRVQDASRILLGLKKLPVFRVLIEIEVDCILIQPFPKI